MARNENYTEVFEWLKNNQPNMEDKVLTGFDECILTHVRSSD